MKEQPVAGYKSEVNGYNITNTKDAKTTVAGTKTWNDNNATDRPSTIQVDLLQNGNVIQTQDVTAANNWNYTFADLPAYDAIGVALYVHSKRTSSNGIQIGSKWLQHYKYKRCKYVCLRNENLE